MLCKFQFQSVHIEDHQCLFKPFMLIEMNHSLCRQSIYSNFTAISSFPSVYIIGTWWDWWSNSALILVFILSQFNSIFTLCNFCAAVSFQIMLISKSSLLLNLKSTSLIRRLYSRSEAHKIYDIRLLNTCYCTTSFTNPFVSSHDCLLLNSCCNKI